MTNPIINPSYSGVTIQISNPAVNVGPQGTQITPPNIGVANGNYATCPQGNCYFSQGYPANNYPNPQESRYINSAEQIGENYNYTKNYSEKENIQNVNKNGIYRENSQQEIKNSASQNLNNNSGYTNAYPADYYMNKYNNPYENQNNAENTSEQNSYNNVNSANRYSDNNTTSQNDRYNYNQEESAGFNKGVEQEYNPSAYRAYAESNPQKEQDFTKSNGIISELDERNAQMQEEKKNTKETKIVALTDAYIKSLENYLNNPNDDIRLMASKEILTRLDEDKDRYDDAALNALLNKMLQDPAKLVRIAALSAFASGLASGNDYTVQLLQKIQANPDADKEDVLQAADILLKMSAGTEVKNVQIQNQNNNVQK